jgi:hypothetical protein
VTASNPLPGGVPRLNLEGFSVNALRSPLSTGPRKDKKSLGLNDGLYWDVVKAATREQLKTACEALEAHNPQAVEYLNVGRCRLTVSKPVLKAPLGSTL